MLIAKLNSPNNLLAILNIRPSQQWILQSTELPVVVGFEAHILVRTIQLTDADCAGLSDEIASIGGQRKCALSGSYPEDPCSPFPTKRPRIQAIQETRVVASSTVDDVASKPMHVAIVSGMSAKFPMMFACQMSPAMEALDNIKEDVALGIKFHQVFPNTLYVKKTYYKHRQIYRYALHKGLLMDFVAAGKTVNGKWSTLVHAVQAHELVTKSDGKPSFPSVNYDGADSCHRCFFVKQ